MSDSLKIIVPGTFTDTTLPILRADPILPNEGALALIEPGHPANPVVGVPANSAVLPNLALNQAQAMYPSGTDAGLSASMFVGSLFDTGGIRERTTKGGLHLAAPTASTGSLDRRAIINGGADIRAYIGANTSHSFYTAMWGVVTRIGKNAAGGVTAARVGAAFNVAQYYMRPTGSGSGPSVYPTDARKVGARAYGAVGLNSTDGTSKADTGPFLYTEAVSTVSSSPTVMECVLAGDILTGSAAGEDRYPGVVLYRFYIEDLTVSGRSFATVDALTWSEFNRQVLTAGGRYYGDTWTAPPA